MRAVYEQTTSGESAESTPAPRPPSHASVSMTSSQPTKFGYSVSVFVEWNWFSFVCHPLYPPDGSQEVAAVPRWSRPLSSCPFSRQVSFLCSSSHLLPPHHFILLSSPACLPLTSVLLSFDLLTLSSTPFFLFLFHPPALSSHLPPLFPSSDPLLSFLVSSPLVLPSLLWRLNSSLSSQCLWAEVGYCWCCSHRNMQGAGNSPAACC